MDYIAPNRPVPSPHPRGVFYNYERKLGGIRYYQASKSQVKEEKKKVIVKVNPEKAKPIVKAKKKPVRLSYKKTKARLEKQKAKKIKQHDYQIEIKGVAVDFGKEGIKKAKIKKSDRAWLVNAQDYFLTVRENNKAIGSAKDYTTMSMLEALWSTAKTVGVDPKRYIVQVFNESRFNPHAKGRAGERGIGQFKKSTALYHGYDWNKMTDGIEGFAYQAKASAEFVKSVGEVAYNGKGSRARRYQSKINSRLEKIALAQS